MINSWEEELSTVFKKWNSLEEIEGRDPNLWRKRKDGSIVYRPHWDGEV